MPETKRTGEEVGRLRQQAQEQAMRVGQKLQAAEGGGLEVATRSISEMNRGLQAIAIEMTDFSKRRLEDVLQAWEQLLRARNFGEMIDVQGRYAQGAYSAYMSEISKLGKMYLGSTRDAAKPLEQTSRRVTSPE